VPLAFSDHHGIATPHDFGIADTPRHYPLSRMRDRAVSKLRSSVLIAPVKGEIPESCWLVRQLYGIFGSRCANGRQQHGCGH
jgi:hypothetical protein